MESPFEAIRKNQKVLLATLGIMAMVSFVVLPPLMDMFSGQNSDRRGDPNEPDVAATWKYGNITNANIHNEIRKGQVLANLLGSIYARSYANGLKSFLPEDQVKLYLSYKPESREDNQASIASDYFRRTHFPQTESSYVDKLILEKLGEELGIKISDEQINQYLEQLREKMARYPDFGENSKISPTVSSAEMNQILSLYQRQEPWLTGEAMYKELGRVLLREEAIQLMTMGVVPSQPLDTPLLRWENYVKLNRKASVLAMPILVETFLDKVPDPTAAELQAFFDERKNRFQVPNSPEYGFRIPPRASFQYFRIDNKQLLAAQKPLATEAEIQAYYEKNKVLFVKKELPPIPLIIPTLPVLPDASPPAESGAAPPASTTEKGQEPAAAEKNTPEKSTPEKSPTENPPPAEKTPAVKTAAEQDATKKGTAEKEAEKKAPAVNPAPPEPAATPPLPGKNSQATPSARRVIPVAFQTPSKQAQSEESKTAETQPGKTDPAKAESPKTSAEKTLVVNPSTATTPPTASAPPAATPPTATPPTAATTPPTAATPPAATTPPTPVVPPTAAPPAVTTESAAAAITPPHSKAASKDITNSPLFDKPTEYEPLENVRDQVISGIAQDKVNEVIPKLLERLEDAMRKHVDLRELAKLKSDPTKAFAYPPFELAKFAAENAVEARELTQQPENELQLSEIGKSFTEVRGPNNQLIPVEFARIALNEKLLTLYSPTRSEYQDVKEKVDYLSWKTEELPAEEPKLDNPDVKLQVIRAWKTVKARDLAKKQAEEYAVRAVKEGKTLNEMQASDPTVPVPVEVNDFPWLKPGRNVDNRRSPPEISTPSGLDHPGEAFMETIFELPLKGIGTALNHPQTIAYVIQVMQRDDLESTREKYLKDVSTPQGYGQFAEAGYTERMKQFQSLFENLRKKYELQELRPLNNRAAQD